MRCVQKSPGFPDRYAANKDCVYVINAPNGKQVQLNVESFDLEESNGCSFDSLEIRFVFIFQCHKNWIANVKWFVCCNLEMEHRKLHHWLERIVERIFCQDLNRSQTTFICDLEVIQVMKMQVRCCLFIFDWKNCFSKIGFFCV